MNANTIDWNTAPRNIAVFRALNLGDMLCTIPALRALRCRLPDAHISLLGLKAALPVMRHFSGYLDELIEFPGDPAFPEQAVRNEDVPRFYRDMQERNFDLVLQMHGSGQQSNDIVKAMAPVQWAGFVPKASQAEPGRLLPWPDRLHEIHRYLALLRYLGMTADDDTLEFPICASDHAQADELIAQQNLVPARLIFVHPGARLASRRWPLDRHAAVARSLAQAGWQIAITGSASEMPLTQALAARAGVPLKNLCAMTSLGVLASLLQRSRLLICNDTGISHVAASVHLRSVVIASGSDVVRWAPLDDSRHTVLHVPMGCRPCAFEHCPIGHPCAQGIEVADVLAQAHRHLQCGVEQ